jgi:beta-lactamase class A
VDQVPSPTKRAAIGPCESLGNVSTSDEVRAALEVLPGATGFYARNLTTDEVVESNSDALLPTESAIKVLILLHYSRMVTSGAVDPDRRVALSEDFRNIKGTGVLRYLASGLELRLDDLAWLMTIVSDNVATALLMLEIGGPEAVNATASERGVSGARLSSFDELIEGARSGMRPHTTSLRRSPILVPTHGRSSPVSRI